VSYKFSVQGYRVIVLEKENQFGTGVSSRSTEVIHAGVYYAENSLKAKLCLRGKELLYDFCKTYFVPHKRLGKLFLAVTDKEIPRLEKTKTQAIKNGLTDLEELDCSQLKKLEPFLNGHAALLSPSTGIIDSHKLMETLLKLSESSGTIYAVLSPVVGAEKTDDNWTIHIGGRDPAKITSKMIVNAAGLYSLELSKKIFPDRKIPEPNPVKGGYLRYSGKSPLDHIVYPAVIPGQIEERVDATPDLAGSLRFGPSVEGTNGIEDFSLSPELVDRFTPAIKRYIPDIDESRLHLDQAGIRPKIKIDGEEVPDFMFEWGPEPGWLDLWGMESPALTASLAIGEHVMQITKEKVPV